MSKLTFRADDDLVDRVERLDASKSEVMREALRAYLDGPQHDADVDVRPRPTSIDAAIAERVDALVEERLREHEITVNVNIEGEPSRVDAHADPRGVRREREASDSERRCAQCGQAVASDNVYCPNCGEKRTRRVFCECGDEVRTDWSFCPSCGRRTPAADVLDGT